MLTQQAECVQPHGVIHLQFIVKAIWPPCLREEGDGHGLSKAVQVKPTGTHSREDRGIVDDFNLHSQLFGTQEEV